ncbi:conserved hypothetical protein [Pediculus humanus corporis]|uniref:Dynein axonemal assembly factor 1 homolog n=1 Tax=Pediculus humanus subsp. corporis TaxID=121224 RepID=E0VQ30_PEDHC|nr:uncharacterized protein Phum_PHUM370820 [Pediculus humanus corporis]EEB15486.1 conserved hypothetical protein [Pediculus humanus corporis]
MGPRDVVYLQTNPEGFIQATRSQRDRDKNPDRISLDRRGLTHLPNFVSEKNIKMLSLQHNLISRIDGLSNLGFNKLVFLDLYNNQVENFLGIESLENLKILLFGKNRLKKINGLKSLTKLEVLDLHGNQINQISSLNTLSELKILNLAGNQIRVINHNDLDGLSSLKELNLKRNRLKKIYGLNGAKNLEKLFVSNNEISCIEDLNGVCKALSLKEVTIDGNPISSSNDCVHFLVSHLSNLKIISHIQVTEQVRRNAMLWRKNRENLVKTIAEESLKTDSNDGDTVANSRNEVISNAKNNWESLINKTKRLPNSFISSSLKDLRNVVVDCCSNDLIFEKTVQSDSVLSVTSSISLSSRRSASSMKPQEKRKFFGNKRSLSEETSNTGDSIPDCPEYFKLPPILKSLAPDKLKELSSTNSDISTKCQLGRKMEANNEVSDESEEITGDLMTDDSEEEEEERKDNNVNTRQLKSANLTRKSEPKKDRCHTAKAKTKYQVPGSCGKTREQGGDYLIEICGRCLNVYGQGALRFIDRPWNPIKAGDVTTVKFNYVSFGGICFVLSKLKQRFPNAENFVFRETNITYLGQLNALADVQGLHSLQIDKEGNPITGKNWKNYAIYRLAHWGLKKINGIEITERDLAQVAAEYQSLSDLVLWSLPENLLQPLLSRLRIDGTRTNPQQTARQWLMNADPALRSVVCKEALQWRRGTQDDLLWRQKGKNHLSHVIELTCSAIEKLQLLDSRWSTILNQMIRDTLVDFSHMDSYMKKCINDLQKQ